MTYPETLNYLFTQLPMYQRAGATAMKKDLGNIRALLTALGNPERDMGRVVHVAGTNGKGTTCHLLAAALQAHGYRVGMYTSPHYLDFRERIKINAAFIPEGDVTRFVEWLRAVELPIEPSFFEITVAMAFDYFRRARPDWTIVEVGLGGRLDSTNLVVPDLCVITNIGYDHMQFLGDTLELIAGEKAGIIKPGVPVVVGETQVETTPVFERVAAENDAPISWADQSPLPYPAPPSDVGGPHAAKNLRTALAALVRLDDLDLIDLNAEKLARGWTDVGRSTYYVGRFQTLRAADPFVLADSAHNAEGLRPITDYLKSRAEPLHVVLGVVNDKDLGAALPLFPAEARYYFVKADIPRGLGAEVLRGEAANFGLMGRGYSSVRAGFEAAVAAALGDGGMVFVGGSVFVVAEVI